ncbi:hypothetical protein B9Z19DRAFT_1113281 [Tuber borchii]|uniref:Uncharacterized protein n=1 Tax=Tuber borchii TaxID=42251 RepID=A0A2T7A1Q1_TUBBO|nr:hypothetical protein B9Z19DRAFT_1113281 [Tuber borchii]
MPDGNDFDGKHLLSLVRSGSSPFEGLWDVNLLIQEIEANLDTQVIEIPDISTGSNNYGLYLKLSNRPDIVARLSRGDVNMPNFEGPPIHKQILKVEFEVAVYQLLRSEPNIFTSRLLYHRIPVQHVGPRLDLPKDIAGRHLFLFERAEGEKDVWWELSPEQQDCLLAQSARIHASLFNLNLPLDFATRPKMLPIPVAPTREFCVALFMSKIEATIKNIGDMIGWESDNVTVGPIAAAAKQSLLRLIPHIMPADNGQPSLYRLVLDHGDFGIHNMLITMNANGEPPITSLYDWETGHIVPAILSDPLMRLAVDLVTDENAAPSVIEVSHDATLDDRAEYKTWARQYFKVLFNHAPNYKGVIEAGKDARHLWFALREWRGQDPEGYFGDLGAWAERRMKELGVDSAMSRIVYDD